MPSAQQVKWAQFRVSVVGLVAVLIFVVLIYLLTGGTLLTKKTRLYLYIPDATGLDRGSPVRVDGIDVGKVHSVALSGLSDPNRVILVTMTVELSQLASMPVDSYAEINADTIVGDRFVDVTSGHSRIHLRPQEELRYQPEPELLKSLDLQQFQERLQTVSKMMDDIEQGRTSLGQFIVGEQMYHDLTGRVAQLQHDLEDAAKTTGSVGHVLRTEELYRKINAPLVALDRTLAQLQAGQGSAGRFVTQDEQYTKLLNQAQSLRHSIADIRAGKGSMGTLVNSDKAYTDWNNRIAALIQKVDDFNTKPLMANSTAYDNLNGFAKDLRDTLQEFRRNPEKFLRINVF
ncbi:MAG TPA: MlaD family protein [Bryobacteraceae bacterium]|nr:MlaD family protein [Bryobacteraceae bacterium]